MKTTPKMGKVSGINLVTAKTVRAAGRATVGVKLLVFETADKVVATTVIP